MRRLPRCELAEPTVDAEDEATLRRVLEINLKPSNKNIGVHAGSGRRSAHQAATLRSHWTRKLDLASQVC